MFEFLIFFSSYNTAYDLGVPVMFSTINVRIYPPESKTRSVTFVLPGHNIDRKKTEDILSTITGGRVIIHDIQPYNENHLNEGGVDDSDGSNIKIIDGANNKKDLYVTCEHSDNFFLSLLDLCKLID